MSTLPEPVEPSPTLDDIGAGIPVVEEVTSPAPQDLRERHVAELAQLELKLARSRIKNIKADRKMRKTYAGRILFYLEAYSAIVALMVIFAGFEIRGFKLPVEILASLVGSTAIAAIGLVGFIARGLFRPPTDNSN